MKALISPGFGAGFSTWENPKMAIDKDLIELLERGCTGDEIIKICIKKGYYKNPEDIYFDEWDGLEIHEVPEGCYFKIREYDGSEFIEIFNKEDWFYAED